MLSTFVRRLPVLPVAIAVLLSGSIAYAAGNFRTPTASTQKDLREAMHGEAFAYLTYLAYADAARARGNVRLATLFEKTANIERSSHFAGHAAYGVLVKGDASNLRAAITGENHENVVMYPEMAKRAHASGDVAAANWFAAVGKDEGRHRDDFKSALKDLER